MFKAFKNKFVEFESKIPARFLPRDGFSKEIYEFTKNFLEENKDKLSPQDKGEILNFYIYFWEGSGCELSIESTEYAEKYKGHTFGKYGDLYPAKRPMTAGFNLSNADLSKNKAHDVVFLSVNFRGAKFSGVQLTYSHFGDCDLTDVNATNANLNQCRFVNSDLRNMLAFRSMLGGATFGGCDLRGAALDAADKDINISDHSICDAKTSGLSEWQQKWSVEIRKYNGLQNVDDPKVMAYWMGQIYAGEKLPPLLRKVIEERSAQAVLPSNIVDASTVEPEGKVVDSAIGSYPWHLIYE